MNIELLNKVKAAILAEPEHFQMDDYYRRTRCGTAACIAGWAIAIYNGESLSQAKRSLVSLMILPGMRAAAILQIDDRSTYDLFSEQRWPSEFRDLYRRARERCDHTTMATVAADRIDHFIATGGKE